MNKHHTLRTELTILAGYTLLTIIFTYPLIVQLNTHIIGLAGDAESHMWSYWWMRKAMLELHTNPYFTQWLYYPEGVSLYFYAYNVVHAVLSIPLQSFLSLITIYNLTEMLGFVAAAYSACWLARDVTGSRRAGFIAGIVYAFAPIQVFHFNLGQPNLHGVEFIPLYILALRRWLNGGHYRWLLTAAIALALNSFSDWQFAVYMQLFTAIALLAVLLGTSWQQWRAKLWSLGWRTAALQVLYVLTVAPVVIPMVQELTAPRPYMVRSRRDTVYHAPDLLAFLLPNPEHPLWKSWAWQVFESIKTPGVVVATVSLSYVALVLAVIAVMRNWQQTRFWVLSGATFLILALGPQLRIMGIITDIPLPYEVLFQFKIIQVTRAPARYFIITTLCMGVLAAIGTRALLNNPRFWQRNRTIVPTTPRTRHAIFASLLLLLCFEHLPIPVNAEPAAPTPAFMTDGTLQQAGAIMEWPDAGNRSMYYATVHEHPVMYGEMSRDNPPGPLLSYLRKGPFYEDIIAPEATWYCLVDNYHITHMMVYHNEKYLHPVDVTERRNMLEVFIPSLPQIAFTPRMSLYQLPASAGTNTCITLGKGWSKARHFGPDQPLYRWMRQQGTIELHRQTAGEVELHFHAHSFAITRQLEVYQAGQRIAQFTVNELQPYTLDLTLPTGLTTLQFRSVEPATSPAEYGYEETEPVSIGLSQLRIEEKP